MQDDIFAIWQLTGLVLLWCLAVSEILSFCIIYCVSTLSLHIESTNWIGFILTCILWEICNAIHPATTTVCTDQPILSTIMGAKLHGIQINNDIDLISWGFISVLVVFHFALWLVACDTGPFQSRLLFGLWLSRYLHYNQLTRLPEGLLDATTQLQNL